MFFRYGFSERALSRIGWTRRFDKAIVWFLDCVQQLGRYAMKRDGNVQLGYRYAIVRNVRLL